MLPQPFPCFRRLVAALVVASGLTPLAAPAEDCVAPLTCGSFGSVRTGQRPVVTSWEAADERSLPADLQDLLAPPHLPLPDTPEQLSAQELRPLTLAEARLLAQVNDPALQAARLQVESAEAQLRSSLALWYPTAKLSSSSGFPARVQGQQWTRRLSPDAATPESTTTGDLDYYKATVALSIQWNLLHPQRVPRIAADRDALEQARMNHLIHRRELDLQTAEAYYSLQLADEAVKVAETSVETSRSTLHNSRLRYEAGVVTLNNVLEAQAQLAADEALQARAQAEQTTARRRLAAVLNLPHQVTPTAKDPNRPKGVWTATLEESLAAAFASREELQQFVSRISESNSRANAALATLDPRLYLFSIIDWQRRDGSNSYGDLTSRSHSFDNVTENRGYAVGLGFDWSLYDGGAAQAKARRWRLQAEREALLLADARNTFRSQVESTFYNLYAQQSSLQSRALQVKASREALRLTSLRYNAGISIQQDVIDRQRELTGAATAYARTIAEYNRGLARLHRYTGLQALRPCNGEMGTHTPDQPASAPGQTTDLTTEARLPHDLGDRHQDPCSISASASTATPIPQSAKEVHSQ